MLEKIKNTDFREVAVTLGIIGLFVIIVSITSDTKQDFHEWIFHAVRSGHTHLIRCL